MEKKISIIIPVYNTEKYITRCINSVINQTYKNIEVICIDDGSTDSSGVILDQLAQQDSRIVVIHKENEGVSAARNAGLVRATGHFIGFVDSDDYIMPEMYECLVSNMIMHKVDVVTCNYFIDVDGKIVNAVNQEDVPNVPLDMKDFLHYIYLRDIYKGVAGYLWTRLYRKEIIKDEVGNLNVWFKTEYGGADDIVFVAETNIRCKRVLYIDKPLYFYYQRSGSIVHDDEKQIKTLTWPKAYEKIIDIYRENQISKDVIDIICRMYVYRCGKILEAAEKEWELYEYQIGMLKEKVKENLLVYIVENLEYLERVQWIIELLLKTK